MKAKDVEKIIDSLFKMQEIDVQIAELKVSKVYKPRIVSELKEAVDSLNKELSEFKEKLQKTEITEKNMQIDIESIKERLTHAKQKLTGVSSNREYEAVQDEIIENEEMLAQKEEELLGIYDNEEEYRGRVNDLTQQYEAKKKEADDKIEKIEEELSHVEENINQLEEKRNEFIGDVPRRVLSTYNRIRKGERNQAIVHVRKRACGGCSQLLPPQKIQDLKRSDQIVTCPSCGVILAWCEEGSPDEG